MTDKLGSTNPQTSQVSKAPAKPRSSQNRLSGMQVMFAVILAIGMMLAINFSTRIASSRPLEEYYRSVEAEIEVLQLEQATLIAERDYAQSDAYVEIWARGDGKMVRPGQVLVVPLPAGGTTVDSAAAQAFTGPFVEVETSPPRPENWMLWWNLFFDSPPPEF